MPLFAYLDWRSMWAFAISWCLSSFRKLSYLRYILFKNFSNKSVYFQIWPLRLKNRNTLEVSTQMECNPHICFKYVEILIYVPFEKELWYVPSDIEGDPYFVLLLKSNRHKEGKNGNTNYKITVKVLVTSVNKILHFISVSNWFVL